MRFGSSVSGWMKRAESNSRGERPWPSGIRRWAAKSNGSQPEKRKPLRVFFQPRFHLLEAGFFCTRRRAAKKQPFKHLIAPTPNSIPERLHLAKEPVTRERGGDNPVAMGRRLWLGSA